MNWCGWIQSSAQPKLQDDDDDVFAIRFRCQLAMFERLILIKLSRLLHRHIAYDLIRYIQSTAVSNGIRYTMMKFSLIDSVISCLRLKCVYWLGYIDYHAHIVYDIATAKIAAADFCRILHYLEWFGTVELNRLPCPNNKIYDDEVFADRFRYQLNMFEHRVLVRLSRLLHAHMAYEIAVAKITAEICGISYCLAWFDAVEFNRLLSANDKMYDGDVFAGLIRYQLTYVWNADIDRVIAIPSWS